MHLIWHIETVSNRRLLIYMILLFVLSHAMYLVAGVRFDDGKLGEIWQYLDPELLRNRLLESLFFLHSQPPAFNLFLGLTLKLCPGNPTLVFGGLYLAGGLLLYLATFLLMRRLGVSRVIALGLSTLVMWSPSFILYEHWLFYTFPLTVLLTLSGVFWYEFLNGGRYRHAIGLFSVLFLPCAMRSAFHLFYFALIVGVLVAVFPQARKKTLLSASLPLLLLFLLYFKNYLLFGTFGTSTWLGMNLAKVTLHNLSLPEREQLVREGQLSRLALIEPFSELDRYPSEYLWIPRYENIPALKQVKKSTGFQNYNHLAYVGISRGYLTDSLWVIRHRPRAYLIGIGKAFYCYFKPSSDYWLLAKNRRRIAAMDAFYNRILFLKIFLPISHEPHDFYISVSLVLGIPLVTAGGVWLAWRSGISRAGLDRNQRLLLLFLCVNIVYITLVGNLFESGENNRFRFMIEPSLVALLGVFMQHQWLAKTRRGSRPAGSPGPCAPPAHFGGAAHKGPDYAPLPTTEHVLRQRRTESRLGRQEEAPGGTGDPLG